MRAGLAAAIGIGLAIGAGTRAAAQSPMPGGMKAPAGMSLAQSNAMRFPQPIAAGLLPGRVVLRPVESQQVLGRVRAVVRDGDGRVSVVMRLSGPFGFGGREIAVPVDAMALRGRAMVMVAFDPAQLRRFPPYDAAGETPVAADTVLRIGLAKPSH